MFRGDGCVAEEWGQCVYVQLQGTRGDCCEEDQ